MIKVIGIKFRCSGKLYYFDPKEEEFERGELVIVETARGNELGTVVAPNREVTDDEVVQPLKPIIRKATEDDIKKSLEFREKEADAFKRCKEKIREHGLEMKLVKAEYVFDGSKLVFYFTADGRIDFRELVKDLASMFRTRIELRQIGVRDEAMICGGVGVCGRGLCCKTFLNDFIPVSIKMAKEQNLSLNPTKISGVCGRLMCCLKNEQETYEYLNASLPRVGDEVIDKFEGRKGKVSDVNVLRQKIKVLFKGDDDSNEIKEFTPEELRFTPGKRKLDEDDFLDEELAALLKSEEKDQEIKEEQEGGRKNNNRHGQGGRRGDNRQGGNRPGRDGKNREGKNDKNREGKKPFEKKPAAAGASQSEKKHRPHRNRNRNRNRNNGQNQSANREN